jgi:hypothetical protein
VEDDPQRPEWWPLGVGAQLPLVDGRASDSGNWRSALKSARPARRSTLWDATSGSPPVPTEGDTRVTWRSMPA